MWLAKRIKRLWRGRGHGVHSPFAYRFITNVLRLKGRYYASDELDRLPDARWCTLLFRLVCEFEPETVEVPEDSTSAVLRALALAVSRVEVKKGVYDASGLEPVTGASDAVRMFSKKGAVTAFRDIKSSHARAEWRRKLASMTCGMTFTDGRMAVIVERPDLARQDFEIDFRL